MIKARGTNPDGTAVTFFGLTHANLDRLREGRPIAFDGRPYGIEADVVIFADVDEQTMERRMVGPDTRVHREPGAP